MKKITTTLVLVIFLLSTTAKSQTAETFAPQKITPFLQDIAKLGFTTEGGEKIDAALVQSFITSCNKNKNTKELTGTVTIENYEIDIRLLRRESDEGDIEIRFIFEPGLKVNNDTVARIYELYYENSKGNFDKAEGLKKKKATDFDSNEDDTYKETSYANVKALLKTVKGPSALLEVLLKLN